MNSNGTGDLWFAVCGGMVPYVHGGATAPSLDNLWDDYITVNTSDGMRACDTAAYIKKKLNPK